MSSIAIYAQSKSTKLPPKVSHAEPLYVDLMRDLGARAGEAEFNLGAGFASHRSFNEYNGFVEYEWAPVNRLGLEVQLDYALFQNDRDLNLGANRPQNGIESVQLAGQYTFLVDEKRQTSMAVGYTHAFELNSFRGIGEGDQFITGMRMNPIFIAATKWKQLNMLLYTGPVIENHFLSHQTSLSGTVNTSFLYVLPNTHNFIGIENNMDFDDHHFKYYIRPQMKLTLLDNLAIGFVTGLPLTTHESTKMEFTTRIIWEP